MSAEKTGDDVVRVAREWLKTPWQHQAMLKGIATDCLGLIAGVGLELELPGSDKWRKDARTRGYGWETDPRAMFEACHEYLLPVKEADMRNGDILLLRFNAAPQHFAIVSSIAPRQIIHAYAQLGRVTENGINDSWAKVVRVYRYPGLA